MSSHSQMLEDVKQDIRSVLLTAPKGLPLQKFCRDYRDIVGRNLPFNELGYRSPEDFLKSIPDVLTLLWFPQINNYVLNAVADEKTSHIEKLVSRQKVSKQNNLPIPKRRGPRLSRNSAWFREPVSKDSLLPTPSVYATRPATKKQENTAPPRFRNTTSMTCKGVLPAATKLDIDQILDKYDEGISIQTFPMAFLQMFGKSINYQLLGFSSLQECLLSVPCVELIEKNGQKRVCKIRSSQPKKEPNRAPHARSNVQQTSNSFSKPSSVIVEAAVSHKPSRLPYGVEASTLQSPADEDESNNQYYDISGISDTMKKNFREILKNNPQGVWAANFPDCYEELTGNRFDLAELGYFSLISLVDALPNVFRRDRPKECKSDWLLFDASLPESQPSFRPAPSSNVIENIAYVEEVISNTRKILEGNPEGAYIDDFIHLYSLNCESPLVLNELGFSSIENFLLRIADRVPLKFNYSNARKKVQLGYCATPLLVHPQVHQAPSNAKIQDDAVLPGWLYEWQKMPSADICTDYIPIRLGTVVDPSLMWIQLEGKSTSNALDLLMNDLDEFYTSFAGDSYMMQDQHIVVGTICAGVWSGDGSWHRVSIIGMVSTEDVDVTFVDYGTKDKVKRTELRYLRKCFAELPAQAIKSRMAFVKPKTDIWDKRVRERLLAWCRNKVLMAEIVQQPPQSDIVSLWICDISKPDDVYLSMLLVEEGFAEYCPQDSPDVPDSRPERPSISVTQSDFSVPPRSSDRVSQSDLINAISVIAQAQTSTASIIKNERLIETILESLSICGSDGNPINIAVLQHLLCSGMDSASLVQLLASSHKNTPSTVPPPSNVGYSSFNNFPAVPSYNSHPYLGGNHLQAPQATSSSLNCYPAIPPPAGASVNLLQPPVRPSLRYSNASMKIEDTNRSISLPQDTGFIKPPTRPANLKLLSPDNSPLDSDSEEIFEDDEEEALDELCSKYSFGARRFVQRVTFSDGYRLHIILIEKAAFVSCGDVSHLLWTNEDSDCLYRRLRGKEIAFPTITVSDRDYPEIFEQLKCYNVKGVNGNEEQSVITLFQLKNVVDILNIFGHPSRTIRSEIAREVQGFNPSQDLWRHFSCLDVNDGDADEESFSKTDSDKFHRMCIFDLKSTQEGLQFKRLKIMNGLVQSKDPVVDPVKQVKKLEEQFKLYEKRIKEIESLCKS